MQWWQTAVFYQIYPRSFQDSTGDGVGDLPGITSRLDYLADLGVDALWLSPIFPSPMADFGYDISSYTDIDPRFGTLADFDALLAKAHELGLRVLLDFVPNHTSDQHPWFQEARAARDNPQRDWYIWQDPAADGGPDGGPPNNWQSYFKGPAWTFDEASGQYYLHSFLPQQPDLNWRNPAVREAMHDVLRFWLDRGVDGFRMDAIQSMIKDAQFRDEPLLPDRDPAHFDKYDLLPVYSETQPELQDVLRGFRAVLDTYPGERVCIGETPSRYTPEMLAIFSQPDRLHLAFNFRFIRMQKPWQMADLRAFVDEYDATLTRLNAWPNWVMSNHDSDRLTNRLGPERIRLAALLLLTLRGTPCLYYGDEIGMLNGEIPRERWQDPAGLRGGESRDPSRTPMQWDSAPRAGFTQGEPWLPIGPDDGRRNVQAQQGDTASLLSLYKLLLRFRQESPALHGGTYRALDVDDPDCFAFLRETPEQRLLIVLNFADTVRIINLPPLGDGQVVLSTHMDRAEMVELHSVFLRDYEGCIFELTEPEWKGNTN